MEMEIKKNNNNDKNKHPLKLVFLQRKKQNVPTVKGL